MKKAAPKPSARQSAIRLDDVVAQAKRLLDDGVPMIVFDLETTGLSKVQDRILSFSAIKVIRKDGCLQELDRANIFMNPGFHIPEAASSINHITDDTVRDCPGEDVVAKQIREFFGENPFVGGYNSENFDQGFINAMYNRQFGEEFKPALHLDVYKMAKEKLDLKGYKLIDVSHELGADVGIEFHNSMDDVIATLRAFTLLLDMYEEKEEEVFENIFSTKRHIFVLSASYWAGPNHNLQRVYVKTKPYTKTFFDIVRNEWKCDWEEVDMKALVHDVLDQYKAEDEKELVKKLKSL